VANVLVNKYADHTPLYRQAQGLARQGIEIDRSTLAFWVGYAAAELRPLWALMRADLLGSAKLFVDETKAPVLDPGRGRTKTGYFWAIARDDRPWLGSDPPAVVYTYAPGRGAVHAAGLLQDFTGILQTDAYAAYKRVADRDGAGITIAYCWTHLRRQFYDVTKTAPAATIARTSIRRFAPVSARIRRCAAVIMVKITRATALPIDAIESRLNTTARTRHTAAWISSPFEAGPPALRAISGGNWPVSASRSDSPCAGYSPALVAPAVANIAVTVISQ